MQPFRPSMLATLCALTMVLASGTARGDMISDVQQLLGDRGGKLVWTSNHGTNNYEIWMMDFRDCKRVRLTDHPYTDTMPIWSPDGTHIAWKRALGVSSDVHGTKGGTIWVMRADGSGARKVASLPNDSHTSSRLHFWGNHWITYRGSGGVRRVNITTGQTELIARIDKFNASLAPDGRFMNLATQGTGGIGMVDMSTGKWTFLVDGCNNSIAPDSTYRFMHLSMGHKDFVVRSRTGKVAKRLGPPAGTAYVHAPLFSNHPDFCAHAAGPYYASTDKTWNVFVRQISTGKYVRISSHANKDFFPDLLVTDSPPGPVEASATASPRSGHGPLEVTFDAAGSKSFAGSITGYAWDFGDGSQGQGAKTSHTYTQPGSYEVELTVVNDQGASATRRLSIEVLPSQIIIDNTDPGFSLSGSWQTHTLAPGYYGTNYRLKNRGNGSAWARWTPTFETSGTYRVYASWSTGADRPTNAPFTIHHADGSKAVKVSMRTTSATRWNLLGEFRFAAGNTGYVQVNDNPSNGAEVVGDAVKFQRVRVNEAPSVDAGEAQTVVLGSAAHLSALIEDDGLSGNATQVSWSLDSETDVAQILDETAESTSVQFSQVGQYLLRVKVSDGELEAEDTVLITVIETPEQAIDLLSPVGGEVLGAGSTHAIRWTTQDIADVGLDYSCDDGETWERIGFVDDSLDTWGHYPWQVPNWPSASCLVRIMGYSGEAPTQSDDVFRIVSEGALSLADGLGYTAIGGCNVPPAQISAWALLLVVSFLLHLRLRLRRDRRHIARTQVLQPTRSFQLVRSGRLRADAK